MNGFSSRHFGVFYIIKNNNKFDFDVHDCRYLARLQVQYEGICCGHACRGIVAYCLHHHAISNIL